MEPMTDFDLWKQPIGAFKKKRNETPRGYASHGFRLTHDHTH